MKRDTMHFAVALCIVIGGLFVADMAVGVIGDYLAWNMPNFSRKLAKNNYRLHRMNDEIVFLGSSCGERHYVTSQFNDSIDVLLGRHVSVYNAAIHGVYANGNCCAAEVIVSRYHPKLVIIDLPEDQMQMQEVSSDIEFSAPYYWSDTIVKRYINTLGVKEKVLMRSNIYRYNGNDGRLLRIGISYLFYKDADDGYSPLNNSMKLPKSGKPKSGKPESINKEPLYTLSVNNLINVFHKYREANVPIIVVSSPRFKPDGDNTQLKGLCEKYNIPYFDFFDVQIFNEHPEWFNDPVHLNDVGAHEFTALFYESLKPMLKSIDL